MEITAENIREMGEYLGEIHEPRRTEYGNIRHKLIDIIVIGFTATLCNNDGFEEMEEFGRLKQDFFKQFPELPNGIPDESTFRKVINRLEPVSLHKSLDRRLVGPQRTTKERGSGGTGGQHRRENDMREQEGRRERGSRGKRMGGREASNPGRPPASGQNPKGILYFLQQQTK
jgi:hypothetical protein